ncbi:MAG: hypothetical protein QW808_03185 [Desulfurococcaceae archaeon]
MNSEKTFLSLNNKIIVEAFNNVGGLKSDVRHGFALVAQKVNIVPLNVLVTTVLSDGTVVNAGSKAYILEELLSTQPWAKQIKKIPDLLGDKECIIVDIKDVVLLG